MYWDSYRVNDFRSDSCKVALTNHHKILSKMLFVFTLFKSKPHLIFITWDFSVRSSNLWNGDITNDKDLIEKV